MKPAIGASLFLLLGLCCALAHGDSLDAAHQVAREAMVSLGQSHFEIKSFDDEPRDPSQVHATSPIRLVVGDSRVVPVPGIYSNCTADSNQRLIQCDLRLIDDLIDDYALWTRSGERSAMQRQLFRLVLAHELGHIELKHGTAAYHGGPNGFSVEKYAGYKVELDADAYAVRLLDQHRQDRDASYFAIVDMATGALDKSLCPDTFPKPCACPGSTNPASCSRIPAGPGLLIAQDDQVAVPLAGTHPDFVVRFARLLFLSSNKKFRYIYAHEARNVLLHVTVVNEQGQSESTAALFR